MDGEGASGSSTPCSASFATGLNQPIQGRCKHTNSKAWATNMLLQTDTKQDMITWTCPCTTLSFFFLSALLLSLGAFELIPSLCLLSAAHLLTPPSHVLNLGHAFYLPYKAIIETWQGREPWLASWISNPGALWRKAHHHNPLWAYALSPNLWPQDCWSLLTCAAT